MTNPSNSIQYTDPLGGHPDNYPDEIEVLGNSMEVWYHRPEMEGYTNDENVIYDEFLPYDEFSQFAQEQGWW